MFIVVYFRKLGDFATSFFRSRSHSIGYVKLHQMGQPSWFIPLTACFKRSLPPQKCEFACGSLYFVKVNFVLLSLGNSR